MSISRTPFLPVSNQPFSTTGSSAFIPFTTVMGEIINVLHLIRRELLSEPILCTRGYSTIHKAEYYRLLQAVRIETNWSARILFTRQAIEVTARQTIDQITRIESLFAQTIGWVRHELPKAYSKELLEILFEYPCCKIEFVVDRLGIDRRTASKYRLAQMGVLRSEQKRNGTLFINHHLVKLLRE